jgi:hypothetical protein
VLGKVRLGRKNYAGAFESLETARAMWDGFSKELKCALAMQYHDVGEEFANFSEFLEAHRAHALAVECFQLASPFDDEEEEGEKSPIVQASKLMLVTSHLRAAFYLRQLTPNSTEEQRLLAWGHLDRAEELCVRRLPLGDHRTGFELIIQLERKWLSGMLKSIPPHLFSFAQVVEFYFGGSPCFA